MTTNSLYIAVVLAIAFAIMVNGVLLIRFLAWPANGKAAYNERQKYTAASFDRAATAFIVAAFITPQTTLSGLDLGVNSEVRTTLVVLIWTLGAGVLHMLGQHVIARIKD